MNLSEFPKATGSRNLGENIELPAASISLWQSVVTSDGRELVSHL